MISSTNSIVREFQHQSPNNLKLRILGTVEISKMEGGRASPVSHREKTILVLVVKNYTKTDLKVSCPVQLCLIS